jgi:hypothetical protein
VKLAAMILLAACGGVARDSTAYRVDTQHLLETRNDQIRSCYDKALATDPSAAGLVAIQFVVAKKSGEVTQATLDTHKTTASQAVGSCVLEAVKGLHLDPADKHDGQATFVYEFKPSPPAS